jgi:hypothetical protein
MQFPVNMSYLEHAQDLIGASGMTARCLSAKRVPNHWHPSKVVFVTWRRLASAVMVIIIRFHHRNQGLFSSKARRHP